MKANPKDRIEATIGRGPLTQELPDRFRLSVVTSELRGHTKNNIQITIACQESFHHLDWLRA
jgi:hypothetical protein